MSAGGVLIRLLQLSSQNELVFSLLLENVKTCVSTDACLMKIPLPFIYFFFFFLLDPEMFRSLLLTILCGFAVAVINSELDRHWELWKKMHNKVYSHQVKLRSLIRFLFYDGCLGLFCVKSSVHLVMN